MVVATTIEEQFYCKALSNETINNRCDHIRMLSEINQTAPARKNSTSYIADKRRRGL
jgi:hypothetical protein